MQNEINYEFDKVIIGPESFVEIEFSSARRVTIADSNFFYLLHSIKNGNEVYFYNPAFPDFTFDEALEDKIEKEYEEYLANGELNLVDWREIIY